MQSIWTKTVEIPKRDPLNSNISVDVAVIGAGMAGILTGYFLQQQGLNVVILEAASIAGGQTKNTTAKISNQHDLFYYNLIKYSAKQTAELYSMANAEAIESFQEIITKHNIECDFEKLPSYLYSTEDEKLLQQEYEAANSIGINCSLTTETSLPFEVKVALKFNDQAQFHPLKFIKSLAEHLTIYEDTKVISVDNNKVETKHGQVIAKQIVFATHYPIINAPGYFFLRMHQERSYVIAIEKASALNGMYYSIDKSGYSFRNYNDLLLLGGWGHRTGENKSGGKYDKLREAAKKFYPDYLENCYWSAQDCVSIDNIPYIGAYSSAQKNWYVATGFKKWGMTSSMVSAAIISSLILDKKSKYEKIFTPSRFNVTASAKNLIKDAKQSVIGLSKQLLALPNEAMKDIENGHGGIIEHQGHKYGVYKNQDGDPFIVSVKCPHLGCQLEFNPDEKSWDCPCHGSRFDYEGNLIDNPAQEHLTKFKMKDQK